MSYSYDILILSKLMEYCRTSEKVVKEEFHLVLFFPYLSIHQTGIDLIDEHEEERPVSFQHGMQLSATMQM